MSGSWILIGEEFFSEEEKSFFELHLPEYSGREIKGIFAKIPKNGIKIFENLLQWRFSPEGYRIPCWIWGDWTEPFTSFLWPKSPKDSILSTWDSGACSDWIEKVWSGSFSGYPNLNRPSEGRLGVDISSYELLMAIDFCKGSGTLSVARSDGSNASFRIVKGLLQRAYSREITGVDAVYDFISWNEGIYIWEAGLFGGISELDPPVPLSRLINDYYALLKDNIYIFKIISSFKTLIELKPSHSALDDPADPFFSHYSKICEMLSRQQMSIDSLLRLSTISPLRTILFLNRIISLGDAIPKELEHAYVAKIEATPEVSPFKQHKVLVVDDAPFFIKVITRILERDNRFEVIATAKDGIECLEALEKYDPDIITLDLEMPRLDGLSTLKRIMIQNPKPVVVLSAFAGESSKMTYDAFKLGAVDVIEKPKNFTLEDMERNTKVILDRLYRAGNVQLEEIRYLRKSRTEGYSQVVFSSTVTPKEKIFLNILGVGSFSHLIKILFMLDSADWDATMIFLTSVRFSPLQELIKYVRLDCEKPVEIVTQVPVPMYKGWFYLCPQDLLTTVYSLDGKVMISLQPPSSGGDGISSVVSSLWNLFSDNITISCISGEEEDAGIFEEWARKDITLLYLNPSRCLYPGLSIRLREIGVGEEVESLEQLIESWKRIANS
ncbi:MAG: response regulator [Syntrophobacterales bacterium]|nr:response regulator [Syntrophobacterales bacterium]